LCKKRKSHRVPTIYTLIDYDIDWIGYQVGDIAEEVVEKESHKQDELHQKV
jgi:hypothetical protein